jgi:predicted nucleotidyltransferase
MRAIDFVRATAQYHTELCPKAWDGDDMRPEVRAKLLEIAEVFVRYLEIPEFEVIDIVLTGSMANYNWTDYSDFDIHVITRYADLQCDDLAEAFYRAKKHIWNTDHDIVVRGHEAELYVEDVEQPPVSGGVYSLRDDTWIKEPGYERPDVDDAAVVAKVQDLVKQIEVAMQSADDPDDLKRITDKLRRMRRTGLDTHGEFGVENLSFKTLRNMGIIEQLHRAYLNKQDQSLRL